ncbi:MAG: bifunctional methylenetetrahydrofolate dehydrogenase/methenyltetrahydrofolate cyclohydrolase FolD [Pseudomonadota bacterium]
MSAIILDGKSLANEIKDSLCAEIKGFQNPPHLSVILIGDDPASKIYVGHKEKACNKIGLKSTSYRLKADVPQEEVDSLIDKLNCDVNVHGILLQLPLPSHLDSFSLISRIDPKKDVDCFTPVNLGNLLRGLSYFEPCTPAGIIALLEKYDVECKGKKAVILGRSNIVGKPMALMLLKKDATVTICHSKTAFIDKEIKNADIIVAAIGKSRLVQKEWIKNGAVVIDVGMNRLPDGTLTGDVDFDAVKEVASMITPVPGGVGPMTIAMLMKNTVKAYKEQII